MQRPDRVFHLGAIASLRLYRVYPVCARSNMEERPVLQDPPVHWTVPVPEPVALGPAEPRTIGPFRVRSRIGSGGMGDVYLGTGRSGQQVAIKLIRGAQLHDGEFRARFRREAGAAAKVRSRFIANLVDADLDAGVPWLATEYIAGPTLSQALAVRGPMPQEAVLDLVTGVAEALHTIHGAGLVHRDVKPANVILGPDGPCLIDLGVVAMIDATRVTMTGQPVGTPMYMAPEQATGNRATAAADVWALGALAYYAATGNHLFEGAHPAVVLYRVSAEEPSYDDCPAYLRPLLDACLTKDPATRPSLDAILRSLGPRNPVGAGVAAAAARGRTQPGGTPRRGARRVLVALSAAVAGTAVLSGAAIGVWHSLADDGEPDGGGQTASSQDAGGTAGQPVAKRRGESQPAMIRDGSRESPWAQGTPMRLDESSCWTASVDDVQGQLATLTLSCDRAGTIAYGTPTPSEWLRIYAVAEDGTVRRSALEDATAQDTFWAVRDLADPASVTATVTLPEVGPLATVIVEHNDGYGWEWAATSGD
ncbi:serine/threonine protein kinase [Antribacter sp. KLBMP9083]|uniref:Serine/threonine protein kinase n=1 Tax=Antribacter soli TaxID=2910976 RepID=A0AA41QD18_9MICO|nr:serine/threonine-protein kinase [Antribacter soli]MCF4121210.1 serine/threonine protein kinase [Antribacter soli]